VELTKVQLGEIHNALAVNHLVLHAVDREQLLV
jgi:hypothetical protein